MNKLQDAPELKAAFDAAWDDILFQDKFSKNKSQISYEEIGEHFFIAGYKAAIADRAKFDEQNGLIVKELCNTYEVIQ